MAEIVVSAVVEELVGKVSSSVARNYEKSASATNEENVERIEMAVLKVQSAVEVSEGWQISQPPLFRWRAKLKRVAEEGEDILREHKRRVSEEEKAEEDDKAAASRSFTRRIARIVKRYFSPFLNSNRREELSGGAVQRFERMAEGVDGFLRLVESGGRAKRFMIFQPLTGYLLAGKEASCSLQMEGGVGHFFVWPCTWHPERGAYAALSFIYENTNEWSNSFILRMLVRLSESIDVVEIATKCLKLFPSQFKSVSAAMEQEFSRLLSQDISYVPSSVNSEWAEWYDKHLQHFCPDPHCGETPGCSEMGIAGSNQNSTLELLEKFPAPVITIKLQCYLAQNNAKLPRSSGILLHNIRTNNSRPIKLNFAVAPHVMNNILRFPTTVNCYMIENLKLVGGSVQPIGSCEDIGLHILGELLLKGIDHVSRQAEIIEYKAAWSFRHGAVGLFVNSAVDDSLGQQFYLEDMNKRGAKGF